MNDSEWAQMRLQETLAHCERLAHWETERLAAEMRGDTNWPLWFRQQARRDKSRRDAGH